MFAIVCRQVFRVLCVAFIAGTFLSDVYAQTSPVALQGKVLDPSNAVIVGAQVVAIPDDRTKETSAISDRTGQFNLPLKPGKYTIRVTAPNFLETSQVVELGSDGESRDFQLRLSGVRETVTVREAPYQTASISSATKTPTALRDVPQSITVVTQELVRDQAMTSIGDVVRYIPGITAHQGENNRDDLVIRGNRSSADFFLNGVRDDVQYYRDLYNLDRVEALKGPNAMIFGRGGGGGVVNRVTKEALFMPLKTLSLQGGRFGNRRFTGDINQPLTRSLALRFNVMYENSDSFRKGVELEREGVNPTLTFSPTNRTKVTVAYEYLRDTRVADRGITSFQGRPAAVDPTTFYGNPNDSHVRAKVHLGTVALEQRLGRLTLRNRTMYGDYDRFYQNYVPGAASANQALVALTAYNNATHRKNLFNSTDLVTTALTGRVKHILLGGAEFGRQTTDNFRTSGFFNNTATSLNVPFSDPTTTTPVTYRQNATDANNHLRTNVAAAFAQDQVELSRYVQVLAGIRFDRFDLKFHNNRSGENLGRVDNLVSPRAGLVIKPRRELSLYTSYSVSYLPSSGDQFSSLTTITEQVKPEKFNNYEVGVKWDASSNLSFTTAVYRLDRRNTRSTDPNDPTRIVQTGSQRTNGYELGVTGDLTPKWQIAGGYAYQNGFVTRATTAAKQGAQAGQVPHHTVSLWNNYRVRSYISAGIGLVSRSDMFAAIDNTVTLPGYVRADAALFINLSGNVRLQGNLENVFGKQYFVNADSNTNISPGSPRALRVGLTTRF